MIKRIGKVAVLSTLITAMIFTETNLAASTMSNPDLNVVVYASGSYHNWDGVTNVAQFKGADGNFYFAVDGGKAVKVYKTDKDLNVTGSVKLEKKHSKFGTVISDSYGNFYVVTGEDNLSNSNPVETIFISKYDSNGNHIKTVGDNGSSSLAYYYDESFYTREPFEAGNCDAAIHDDVLTVNYGRGMYSGHQSNSAFSVNINDMSPVSLGEYYESHSFAQRVVSTTDGFVLMSEGDCYDRAFTAFCVNMQGGAVLDSSEKKVFDFWVEDGAFDRYDMFVVNENFAHMGGLAALSDGRVAFVAQSAKSLNKKAAKESEEIFIQIFDPNGSLDLPDAYTTTGERSGLAGNNGRDEVINYGVKWLTSYGKKATVSNVQVASTEDDKIVVLYELQASKNSGVYSIVLDSNGEVIRKATLFCADVKLNPSEMPVCVDGKICWAGNKNYESALYVYSLDPNDGSKISANNVPNAVLTIGQNYTFKASKAIKSVKVSKKGIVKYSVKGKKVTVTAKKKGTVTVTGYDSKGNAIKSWIIKVS